MELRHQLTPYLTKLRLSGILRSRAPEGTRWMYTPRPDLTHGTIYHTELPGVLRRWLAPVND